MVRYSNVTRLMLDRNLDARRAGKPEPFHFTPLAPCAADEPDDLPATDPDEFTLWSAGLPDEAPDYPADDVPFEARNR